MDAPPSEIARFESKFIPEPNTGCWLWIGTIDQYGYGQISWRWPGPVPRANKLAHRISYFLFAGPLDPALVLDHKCRVRNCVNPAHLEQVTNKENTRRGEKAQRKCCIRGHAYTPETTVFERDGYRKCLICRRILRGVKNPRLARPRLAHVAGLDDDDLIGGGR